MRVKKRTRRKELDFRKEAKEWEIQRDKTKGQEFGKEEETNMSLEEKRRNEWEFRREEVEKNESLGQQKERRMGVSERIRRKEKKKSL